MTFLRCFLPSFGSFGQAFSDRSIRNKNWPTEFFLLEICRQLFFPSVHSKFVLLKIRYFRFVSPKDRYFCITEHIVVVKQNNGNAKRGVSPHLKIKPCDVDLWPWKSIGFQILLRSKYVPSLVKIHLRMLILVFTRMLHGKKFTQWPWKLIGFQILPRTKYVPSLVKIHWRMLILECSQGCYIVKKLPSDLDNQ